MNPMWTPRPMAARRFPLCPHAVTYYTFDGAARTIKAEVLTGVTDIPQEDMHAVGDAVLIAVNALGRDMDATLRVRGLVADVDDWSLTIRAYARVKTWPAVPGITVENPMPKDAS